MLRFTSVLTGTAALILALALPAAQAPVHAVRIQQVGDTTYFHIQLPYPGDMPFPRFTWPADSTGWRHLGRIPQLVPQDDRTHAVYTRLEVPHHQPNVSLAPIRKPVPIDGLEFVGKCTSAGKAKLRLLFPRQGAVSPTLLPTAEPAPWAEVDVEIDFSRATKLDAPADRAERRETRVPTRDDLEGLWAEAQAARFAVLEAMTSDFGYFGFACAATGRKYGVRDSAFERREKQDREQVHRRLYEMTTGAAAITESLAHHRLLNKDYRDLGERLVDVKKVPGIDIAEHPWKKMMGDKKPAPEPLAKLVPHDNYYIHFKNVRKLIDLGELLDQVGTNITRAYELNSRDYNLKKRYEKQLCLKSSWLGKTFGPAVIKSLAITGNDPYVREGSDVTIIFQVNNPKLFLTAVDPFIREARREFGRDLKETRADYQKIAIESFATPLREVSLHRAAFGDYILYSNSPVGIRRVIDTHLGKQPALADSLDFQYMRTCFNLQDQEEDGFLFLADAFIRQLVGPASKIKEKRRLEALTSLSLVTHGAIFAAWETGQLPRSHDELLQASALRQEEIYVPEGKGVTWDAERRVAVSDAYNTQHFATPLVELPMERITKLEEQEYRRFREEYLQLWRQFFDPVGMRVKLDDQQVKVETYILPMINTEEYRSLRWVTGDGTTTLLPARYAANTLLQGTLHLAPQLRGMIDGWVLKNKAAVGDQVIIRLDDTAAANKLAQLWARQELDPKEREAMEPEAERAFHRMPWTFGLAFKKPKEFEKVRKEIEKEHFLNDFELVDSLKSPYKGVHFHTWLARKNSWVSQRCNRDRKGEEPLFRPSAYTVVVDDMWYATMSEDVIKDLIDQSVAHKERPPDKEQRVQTNASLYLAPQALFHAREGLSWYLEWETHKRALPNCSIWYALYRGGLVRETDSDAVMQAKAMQFLGFVPVSPDGTSYAFAAKTDEVMQKRHGSLRQPLLQSSIDKDSPLARLLAEFKTIRADLRFREDGIHTTLTIDRK